MGEERLTISAFARVSRLSVKALRIYERDGLLLPAEVDRFNGYRYYTTAQLPQAQLIALLRELDLSLAAISTILHAPDSSRLEVFRAVWAAPHHELARREAVSRHVIHLLSSARDDSTFVSQSRQVGPRMLAAITRHVTIADLDSTIDHALTTLAGCLYRQGVHTVDAPLVIYHGQVNADSDGPIEVAVPYSGTPVPEGDVCLRIEPAHDEAFVSLSRDEYGFPGVLGAYDVTRTLAMTQGVECGLSPREVLLHKFNKNTTPGGVAEIAWPYQKEQP